MGKAQYTYDLWGEEPEIEVKSCDHPGCVEAGEFRAPKNRSHLREYFWFCLEHVKEYNKAWDYYKGMTPGQIERSRIDDVTWGRPTWPLGGGMTGNERVLLQDGLDDSVFASAESKPSSPKVSDECREALSVLNMSPPFDEETLKKTYKGLAKQYHPDHNKGCKKAEEQLKTINQAYTVLKKFLQL